MCGIVGYTGKKQAQPILLECLAKLEYRGYDSCGIALAGSTLKVYKDAFRVNSLSKMSPRFDGTAGIGHTRWSTHGVPSQINAHPHCDCTGKIAVVHNGIINNYESLKQQLISEGHTFVSETDTEVISHLIEKYYHGDLEKAVEVALRDIKGSYAIIVLMANESELIVARSGSPLIIGIGDRENFVASDVPAILNRTNRVLYLEDGDVGVISPESIQIRDNGRKITRKKSKIFWSIEQAQKGGYEHFMLKEIHEQPKVIRDTLVGWVSETEPAVDLAVVRDASIETMLTLGCGTSYHAALLGKYIMEDLVGIPARAELASEFNYHSLTLAKAEAIAITQSGETADILIAMRRLKEAGCKVIAITNVMGSTASRIADQTIYTRAGPEISVAATKSFIAQLMVLYQLMMSYSSVDDRRLDRMLPELRQIPSKVQQVLDKKDEISECATYLSKYDNVFFIGRGLNFPIALEGALKLKEISYIHAEGYAAGELKHGPFALLSSNTPVVAVAARDNTYEPILTNIKEVKARGSPVIALAEEGDETIGGVADLVITVPRVDTIFSPVVNTIALHLLAYYAAKQRNRPIDFPRNLAKSVTVE
jgi:glucosamine--fructose-6-phosphate aminotransferase (isomerizing)